MHHLIAISQQTVAAIDRAEAERTAAPYEEIVVLEGVRELALSGTPDEIHRHIDANRALGIRAFTVGFRHTTDPEQVRLLDRDAVAAHR